jgi:hypothetical protein
MHVDISYAQIDNSISAQNIIIALHLEVFQVSDFYPRGKFMSNSIDKYNFRELYHNQLPKSRWGK